MTSGIINEISQCGEGIIHDIDSIYNPVFQCSDVNFYYHDIQALKNISISIPDGKIIALIGPSGCGKSTFLRCLNRMNDLIDKAKMSGNILYRGENILSHDITQLRKEIGIVFQKPCPFYMSIFDNIAFGPRIHGMFSRKDKAGLANHVESCLRSAGLWDEVKDKLHSSGASLSGGQQQRLCIARAMAVNPGVLLMDEPCSALDPISTGKIEELIKSLAYEQEITIVMVTHNMQQAQRASDYTAFFMMGEIIEYGETDQIFNNACHKTTKKYISGGFG